MHDADPRRAADRVLLRPQGVENLLVDLRSANHFEALPGLLADRAVLGGQLDQRGQGRHVAHGGQRPGGRQADRFVRALRCREDRGGQRDVAADANRREHGDLRFRRQPRHIAGDYAQVRVGQRVQFGGGGLPERVVVVGQQDGDHAVRAFGPQHLRRGAQGASADQSRLARLRQLGVNLLRLLDLAGRAEPIGAEQQPVVDLEPRSALGIGADRFQQPGGLRGADLAQGRGRGSNEHEVVGGDVVVEQPDRQRIAALAEAVDDAAADQALRLAQNQGVAQGRAGCRIRHRFQREPRGMRKFRVGQQRRQRRDRLFRAARLQFAAGVGLFRHFRAGLENRQQLVLGRGRVAPERRGGGEHNGDGKHRSIISNFHRGSPG